MSSNKIYMAPLEGITGYIFRNAYNDVFGNVDKYFSPFISSKATGKYKGAELRDILPENNQNYRFVPQILSNNAHDFIELSKVIMDMGYGEININLGCPSPTVVSKHKGAAFLEDTYKLNKFFVEIFNAGLCDISVKTRIGCFDDEEFEEIIKIYEQYPISELIVHPRLMKDHYNGVPNLNAFKMVYEHDSDRLCYNGDLRTVGDFKKINDEFTKCNRYMIGRGILMNPSLVSEIKGQTLSENNKKFHDKVYTGYKDYMSGDKNVLFKMKELWNYMIKCIDCDDKIKIQKKIKKCNSCNEYESIINTIW